MHMTNPTTSRVLFLTVNGKRLVGQKAEVYRRFVAAGEAGTYIAAIHKAMNKYARQVSICVHQLHNDGLIERIPDPEHDGRSGFAILFKAKYPITASAETHSRHVTPEMLEAQRRAEELRRQRWEADVARREARGEKVGPYRPLAHLGVDILALPGVDDDATTT